MAAAINAGSFAQGIGNCYEGLPQQEHEVDVHGSGQNQRPHGVQDMQLLEDDVPGHDHDVAGDHQTGQQHKEDGITTGEFDLCKAVGGDGDDEELEDQGQPGHDHRVAEPPEEIVELVVEQGLKVCKGKVFGDDLKRRGKNVSAGLEGRGDHKNEGIDAAQPQNKRDGCENDFDDGFVFLGSHGSASFTGLPTFSGRATGSA